MLGTQLLKVPFQAQIEITDVCNLRCTHCYHFDTENMPKSKDLNDDKLLQIVQKMIDNKLYSLVITGGEPLANPKTLIKVVEKAKSVGMYVSINTNLLLLNSEILATLKDLKVDSFLVSCPASEYSVYKKITRLGDYDKFAQNLKMLLNADFSCLINMVVTKTNRFFIRSTAADLARLGVKRFSATPACLNVEYPDLESLLSKKQTIDLLKDLKWCVDVLGLGVDTLVALPKCFFPDWWWERDKLLLKNRTCQAGRMTVNISNIGDIRPCPHNPTVYGNLFQESMEDIWKKMIVFRDGSTIPLICKDCSTVESCRGACRTNALAVTGKLNKPDRLTVGPIELAIKAQDDIVFNEKSLVKFEGKLRWRDESNGYHSITSKKGSDHITIVNTELLRFIIWLEDVLPLTVGELMQQVVGNSSDVHFNEIFKTIIRKKLILIS